MATIINLNDSIPAAPTGRVNVAWQGDANSPRNVSASVPILVGDSGSGGTAGLVPAPAAGDAAAGKVLKADGTWYVPPGGLSNPMTTPGDLIVGGAAGAPGRLAAGGAGLVLTANGAGAAPSWQAASGGNGGGGNFGAWANAPTISGAGLTLPWNQSGTFSVSSAANGVIIRDPTQIAAQTGIARAYPATPFTVTAVVGMPLVVSSQTASGLFIADTLTGKAMDFTAPMGYLYIFNLNDAASWAGNAASSAIPNVLQIAFRIVDDGTNVSFYASADASMWQLFYQVTKAASFLGASGFNYLGFCMSPNAPGGFVSTLLGWTISNP